MVKIGAHVSTSGGLDLSFQRASDISAECMQIFISPPRQWHQTTHEAEEINKYKLKQLETGIGSNFIHGTYLINLAALDPAHLQKSIDWLIYALNMAGKLGITGVIFHTGSHSGRSFEAVVKQIVTSISEVLAKTQTSYLILENSAGQGGSIGSKFSELGTLIKAVGNSRLKVCVDTCHAFASGYELRTKDGLEKTLTEFDKEIRLSNLVAFHANDCKFEIGSNKDRHENIGEGFIGKEGFKNLLNHPKLENIPFILEVPGFEKTGPDKKNVDILKSLRS